MSDKLILFGATGDLAKTKILPALITLGVDTLLYGRKDNDSSNYIKGELNEISEKINNKKTTHAYVSLPPIYFEEVLIQLAKVNSIQKIALEKPFGTSYSNAKKLKELIFSLELENKIYLVDHYLGKPALIDLLNLGTEERLEKFNKDLIKKVSINALETNNVASRGAFYDEVGTIKDFVQNHILAIVSTLLMQDGCEISSTECRQRVLEKISYKNDSLIIAQYDGFIRTIGVKPESKTETFVHFDFTYDNLFDIGVSVGKAMSESKTNIQIDYKDSSTNLINIQSPVNSYEEILNDFVSNKLRFSLSFNEALLNWQITEKVLDAKMELVPIIYPQGASLEEIISS